MHYLKLKESVQAQRIHNGLNYLLPLSPDPPIRKIVEDLVDGSALHKTPQYDRSVLAKDIAEDGCDSDICNLKDLVNPVLEICLRNYCQLQKKNICYQ